MLKKKGGITTVAIGCTFLCAVLGVIYGLNAADRANKHGSDIPISQLTPAPDVLSTGPSGLQTTLVKNVKSKHGVDVRVVSLQRRVTGVHHIVPGTAVQPSPGPGSAQADSPNGHSVNSRSGTAVGYATF